MIAPTLSALQTVAACPGSASLHRYAREGGQATTMGRATHSLLESMAQRTLAPDGDAWIAREYQLPPDDAGRLAFLAAHLRLPVPAGALAEVPLGYWPDGSVRRFTAAEMAEAHARGLRYPDLGQWLSGTLDVLWSEPVPIAIGRIRTTETAWVHPGDTLWCGDWKTGDDDHVTPIAHNWQLRAGALLAARWTGARRVIPAICYVNAGECAAAVRAGRVYDGRWELPRDDAGMPFALDAATLDAIERDLRAVLARARGDEDGTSTRIDDVRGAQAAGTGPVPGREGGPAASLGGPLITGPHCNHCGSRAACPALAAEALTLAHAAGWRDGGDDERVEAEEERGGPRGDADQETAEAPGGEGHPSDARQVGARLRKADRALALTPALASRLAGLLPAIEGALAAAKVALRAHVEAHGPLALADGRELRLEVESVTSYRTAETFDALHPIVGEARANEAASYSGESIKAALRESGAPRGAWRALRGELEARGAVVVTGREVMRRRWPAVPVEGGGDGRGSPVLDGAQGVEARGPVDELPAEVVAGPDHGAPNGQGSPSGATEVATRAPCQVCGVVYAVNKSGRVRSHLAPGTAIKCAGRGKPPARAAEQLKMEGA